MAIIIHLVCNRPDLHRMNTRDVLIDVSRLIWRMWTGRLPTGIDRVCLAYLRHFGLRAQAVVQRSGIVRVLTPRSSDRLFDLLMHRRPEFRSFMVREMPSWLLSSSNGVNCSGRIYFNTGHTGLNEPALSAWIARNRIRAFYLLHDLIPITHPEFCRAGEAQRHAWRIRNALQSSTGIIGNSGATLTALSAFACDEGLPIPPMCAAWIAGQAMPEKVHPAQLGHPYFVMIGTIEGRKNHILLLNLWRHLAESLGDSTPKLVIVGQRGWEAEKALAMLDGCIALKQHVMELGSCDDDKLGSLIAGARALLMPSFAEGFGLPVVEALQLRTPVIASDLPVYREIAGDIPCYLSPTDETAWEKAILDFLQDGSDRRRQLGMMSGFKSPSWPDHFVKVEDWLRTLED